MCKHNNIKKNKMFFKKKDVMKRRFLSSPRQKGLKSLTCHTFSYKYISSQKEHKQ